MPGAAGGSGAGPGEGCILAMDPGRVKCGLAVVSMGGEVLARRVVPSEDALEQVRAWSRHYQPARLILGNATGARAWRAALEAAEGLPPVVLVDERRSSEEGRRRYVEAHRRGWRRWLPSGLQTPAEPYDDLVAVILAERYLQSAGGPGER
ncbi:RuvC family protein [Limnochorda pilosa]|uniref:Resolvase n=1 Tax=Limnochorda pilosa TaxID=1555112 RepID=A0A0K2SPW6_LIMPI|nr:hypothetical protein [Limnochorda pilosa]BAS28879.1 resolvase [Limnochorda pilosa]